MMTYYDLLGVRPEASEREIRHAFRSRMRLAHPDRHATSSKSVQDAAEHEAKLLNQAFSALSNPTARARYDADLKAGITRNPTTKYRTATTARSSEAPGVREITESLTEAANNTFTTMSFASRSELVAQTVATVVKHLPATGFAPFTGSATTAGAVLARTALEETMATLTTTSKTERAFQLAILQLARTRLAGSVAATTTAAHRRYHAGFRPGTYSVLTDTYA